MLMNNRINQNMTDEEWEKIKKKEAEKYDKSEQTDITV